MASSTIPKTMRAWRTIRRGSPASALELRADVPIPGLPLAGADVLVRIRHAALNPVDLFMMPLMPTWIPFLRRDPVPGMDFSGEVVAIGPDVNRSHQQQGQQQQQKIEIGTRVAGAMSLRVSTWGRGTLAEYVVVPAEIVAIVGPEEGFGGGANATIDLAGAAGVAGIAGQTAVLLVRQIGDVAGKRVLVNGASGGVGSLLVQVLKGKGAAWVVGVCSGANAEAVRGLGADEVVDYNEHANLGKYVAERFSSVEPQLDAILDCVQGQTLYSPSAAYLKPDGRYLNIAGGGSKGMAVFFRNKMLPVVLGGVPWSYQNIALFPSGSTAREAAQWVRDGLIKQAPVDSMYSFEQVVEAYEKLESKRARGKIITNVSE